MGHGQFLDVLSYWQSAIPSYWQSATPTYCGFVMIAYYSMIILALLIGFMFLKTPPRVLANLIRTAIPIFIIAFGVVLIVAKQLALGTVVFFAGISLWKWMRGGSDIARLKRQGVSSIRSAAFEMQLGKDQVALNGVVLVGNFEGKILADMSLEELLLIRLEILEDQHSLTLLDAYLDRRFSGWRENA